MGTVIVAEKPSLARAIAEAIDPAPKKHAKEGVGWIETKHGLVTWCFGHMLELAPPDHYDPDLKRWSLESLPIKIRPEQWALLPKKDAMRQIAVIRKLLKQADRVINAGDPDREGQMLVDELLEVEGWQGRTDRVLIHDTTPEGIRKALKKIRPNSEFRPLYQAALCRSRADWLVGMNLSRAATKRLGPVISIGRVQTPTLALIVRRDLAIEGHVSTPFWTLHAHCAGANFGITLSAEEEGDRIADRKQAQAIAQAMKGLKVSLDVEEGVETERSPLPYMLSSFQKDAEKAEGWGAKESLKVLQELYEKQLVSYPRTDCAYLPEEQRDLALPLAQALLKTGRFPEAQPLQERFEAKPKVYNNKKVAEHHGLTPTKRLPGPDLPPKLMAGWTLVARRFLATLAPDDRVAVKLVKFTHDKRTFKAKGETPQNRDQSWRVIEPKESQAKILPDLPAGTGALQALVREVDAKQGKTTPPKPYTEASLIADMKAVGKYVENERLRELLKESAGIGTAATQASILETLKQRKYIEVVGRGKVKHLRSLPLGRFVIKAVPATLADPGITAAWEDALNKISRSESDPIQFMEKINAYVAKYVEIFKTASMPPVPMTVTAAMKADQAKGKGAAKKAANRGKGKKVAAGA